jgi:hypothetical protein
MALHDEFDYQSLLDAAERDYFNVGLGLARSCNPKVIIRECFDDTSKQEVVRFIVKGVKVLDRTSRSIPKYRVMEVLGKLGKI